MPPSYKDRLTSAVPDEIEYVLGRIMPNKVRSSATFKNALQQLRTAAGASVSLEIEQQLPGLVGYTLRCVMPAVACSVSAAVYLNRCSSALRTAFDAAAAAARGLTTSCICHFHLPGV